MRYLSSSILVAAAVFLAAGPSQVLRAETAQPSAAENKLRESLRNTMLQLRNSENDKAVAQASLAEAEDKNKALAEQVEKIMKQLAADKASADKAAADLNTKIEERDGQIAQLRDVLEKVKVEFKKMTALAETKEAQRAKLEDQNNQLNRRVAEQQTKNANMYRIANDILARYEKFGLGDALTAREPFTGITRVKLQSLFEEYRDELTDQRIKPAEAPAPAPKAASTPAPEKPTKAKQTSPKVADAKARS
jgi:chromosome segregation ATPase